MTFPLGLWDISLWLAITAVILLITSEMLSPHYGRINMRIDRKKLKNAALTVSILFLITVAIKIINLVLTP
jgi:hypothetical protein